ncbi:DMT family transporter [Hydrogenispora sp. UU3]|uniref:DMT family transporter n=1 Tax=Capillibacterium thermochitinicola TaxID=2699427 RepID=A0A8J6I2D6_9FIRM|nr:DMT family transporter [Capillibacterium thermochitinicola]
MSIVFLLVAGLAGALMAVQGCLNSYLGEKLGLIPATFSVQLLGTLTVGGLLLLMAKGGGFPQGRGRDPLLLLAGRAHWGRHHLRSSGGDLQDRGGECHHRHYLFPAVDGLFN